MFHTAVLLTSAAAAAIATSVRADAGSLDTSKLDTSPLPIRCENAGDIALTFDDGPSANLGRLLSILREAGVKATFHLTTKYLDDPVALANSRQCVADGHVVGLRPNPQRQLSVELALDPRAADNIATFLQQERATLRNALGKQLPVRFVRLNAEQAAQAKQENVDAVRGIARAQGLTPTGFNADLQDYLFPGVGTQSAPYISGRFRSQLAAIEPPAKGSFITVQHDASASSVNATLTIIQEAKARGYRFVTLDECLGMTSESQLMPNGSGSTASGSPSSSSSQSSSSSESAGNAAANTASSGSVASAQAKGADADNASSSRFSSLAVPATLALISASVLAALL